VRVHDIHTIRPQLHCTGGVEKARGNTACEREDGIDAPGVAVVPQSEKANQSIDRASTAMQCDNRPCSGEAGSINDTVRFVGSSGSLLARLISRAGDGYHNTERAPHGVNGPAHIRTESDGEEVKALGVERYVREKQRKKKAKKSDKGIGIGTETKGRSGSGTRTKLEKTE
jgi:hypothetical protein